MVTTCANPLCDAPFRYFRKGKLVLVEASRTVPSALLEPSPQVMERNPEFFWLCDQCCTTLTIEIDNDGTVRVRPKLDRNA